MTAEEVLCISSSDTSSKVRYKEVRLYKNRNNRLGNENEKRKSEENAVRPTHQK